MCSHSLSIVSYPETTPMNQDSAAEVPSLLAHLGAHFLPSSGERLRPSYDCNSQWSLPYGTILNNGASNESNNIRKKTVVSKLLIIKSK